MTSADTLYADALANPDDDGPRRVLADWLSERGDPRGELIVVQCELARCPPKDPKVAELARREGQLLVPAARQWRTALGLPDELRAAGHHTLAHRVSAGTFVLRRGLVEELKVSREQLASVRGALARMPLAKLVVSGLDDAGASMLAAIPAQPSLHELRLRDARLAAAGVAQLARAPLLEGARSLVFHRVNFAPDALRPLARATFARLEALAVIDSYARDLHALAAAGWLAQLQSVTFARLYAESTAVPLLQTDGWRDLRILDLHDSYIPDPELAALPGAPIAGSLAQLVLPASYVGPETVRALVKARFEKLAWLELRGYCKLEEAEVAALRIRFGDKLAIQGPLHLVP